MLDQPTPALDTLALNEQFETLEPSEIVAWVWQTFGDDAVVTSSFQTQSLPLLHIISKVAPKLRVLFLDTGFHFAETIAFREQLRESLSLNITDVKPKLERNDFLRQFGTLYREDPDRCCFINKVEPLDRALGGAKAWITGIRRDQTKTRSHAEIIERRPDGLYKIAPMANWTSDDVSNYATIYDLPDHPLLAKGYPSVGCQPCTRAVKPGEDYREGRWAGSGKKECGLHEDYFDKKN